MYTAPDDRACAAPADVNHQLTTREAPKSKHREPIDPVVRLAVGKKLREARKAKKLSIRKLHDLTGVACTSISRAERGRSGILIETAALLASNLDIPLWKLVRAALTDDLDKTMHQPEI